MEFTYKAKDQNGKITQGTISAASEKEALNNLSAQGYFVLQMTSSTTSSGEVIKKFTLKKVSLKDKIIFTKQLAMMIKGGLPLVEALKALEEQTENPLFLEAIKTVLQDVSGGLALSKAMEKHPKIFPKLYTSVVASGERSGRLDDVLEGLADQLQKDYDLIRKVKSAMTYPAVIVIALIGVLFLMLTFVVPRLKTIFTEMGVALPLPTRMLLGISDFIVHFWYLVIIIVIGIYLGLRYWARSPSGGMYLDKMKIKVPIFGKLVQKIYMARFTRTTGTLVAAGLPMLETLATVKEVVGNKFYRPAFEAISKDVESGVTLSAAMKKHKIFPPMIAHMLAVSEKSGKVDEILFHLADFYDKEVEATTANLASMIEPILILVIGAGIGLAIAAVILPIYSLVNVI